MNMHDKRTEISHLLYAVKHGECEGMTVHLGLHLFLLLWLIKSLDVVANIADSGCQDTCGNVTIPYPFGIGNQRCFMNNWFEVTCNVSSGKAYLKSINMELLGVSMDGLVRVNSPIISSNCHNPVSNELVNLSGSPFYFSSDYNKFTAVGCDNFAMFSHNNSIMGTCLSICRTESIPRVGCYGLNCCQTTVPFAMDSFEANITHVFNGEYDRGCRAAFIVEQYWFEREAEAPLPYDVSHMSYVPAALAWGTDKGRCYPTDNSLTFCSNDGYCWGRMDPNHLCICGRRWEYRSLDYINYISGSSCPGGARYCEDLTNNCAIICVPSQGYNCSSCPAGYEGGGHYCYPIFHVFGKSSRVKFIIIGCCSGLGLLGLLIGAWWLYKVIKRRKQIKMKQKFFKRNGGLLLQQQLSSNESSVDKTKLFASKELEIATDHFNVNRILGQGGQGTVYKGMLTDGRIVAVKKSKVVDEDKLEQFINEVVILSQINHRNVVKLLGCCLETEVPLLVYEFIPNGTLFQLIHDPNDEFPLTWEMRLRIAREVSGALYYLHSAASIPIFHRDIKSANILLDDKYRAKVSDFGTSRSIAVDQTHVTTRVQGTLGYLDPEYFQSSQFTEKSDVYSFGVVLVELLTGQKPVSSMRSEQERSLAAYFLVSMKENRLFEIVDAHVIKEGDQKEEVVAVAKLAKRCLNLNGKKRPTMKEVAMELEGIRQPQGASSAVQQSCEEVDYYQGDYTGPWDVGSSSTGSGFKNGVPLPLDDKPLLSTT